MKTKVENFRKDKTAEVYVMSYNRLGCLKRCLDSVVRNTDMTKTELVIIDAGSTDGSREWLFDNFLSQESRDLYEENGNEKNIFHSVKATIIFDSVLWSYAQSNNNAIRGGRCKYFALLNDDCEVKPNWLQACIDAMENDKRIGHAAHVVLRSDENRVMSCGADLLANGGTTIPMMDLRYKEEAHLKILQNPEAYGFSRFHAYAGFGVYRRDVFEIVGGLPEFPGKIYFDDADYGLKVWGIGLRVQMIPDSVIVHYMPHDETRKGNNEAMVVNWEQFNRRWGRYLKKHGGCNAKILQQDFFLFPELQRDLTAHERLQKKGTHISSTPFLNEGKNREIVLNLGEKYKPLPAPACKYKEFYGDNSPDTWM